MEVQGGWQFKGRSLISLPDVASVNLDDYNIHVIASVLKQWLRDLPSPLMTFELYEEFLRAMGELVIRPPRGLAQTSSLSEGSTLPGSDCVPPPQVNQTSGR